MARRLAALLLGIAIGAGAWWWAGRLHDPEGSVASGQRLQCASYTPFRDAETPQSFRVTRERLAEDFSLLSGRVACIRIYSMKGMELVPVLAREHGLQVIAGAWVNRDDPDTEREIAALVAMARQHPDVIRAVLVGNEVLLRRERTAAQLLAYFERVRAAVGQPVSYGDVWEFWLQNPEIAAGVDFATIHLLPYWENDPTPADRAVEALAGAHARIATAFPGKPILIGETGWPSEGRRREGAQPGRVEAAGFLRAFVARAEAEGWRYNLIEAFDQPWKRAQEGAVGGYWGLFDEARRDKGLLSGPVSDLPLWRECLALATLAWLLLALAARPGSATGVLLLGAGVHGVSLHLYQMGVYSRSLQEHAWFVALALAALACSVLGARGRAGGRFDGLREPVLLLALALAAVEMLGLVFDSRYRHFPLGAFVGPALAVALLGFEQEAWRARARVLGALMLSCVPVVLWHEGLANVEALAWCVLSFALGAGALRPVAQRPPVAGDGQASASSASTAAGAP